MTAAETAFEKFQTRVGETDGLGDWFEMTQERINDFADVTIDHQFIHVDEEAAKAGPFGTTIAHGFLTLSMLTHLAASVPQDPDTVKGAIMGVNYGFDKVRFVSPVPVDSKIRATSVVKDVQLKDPSTIQVTRTYNIEVEGNDRPAVVADWITRLTYA
jgi:acyl dehydratase